MALTDYLHSSSTKRSGYAQRLLEGLTTESAPLPIEAKDSKWTVYEDPERLVRSYEFSSLSKLLFFITELLEYQEEVQHHARITVDGMIVVVETFTHDYDGVTRQDKLLAKFCDEIYSDSQFIT